MPSSAGARVQARQHLCRANTYADDVADAVGHPGLAGAVSSLAHSWNGNRAKMLEGIQELGDATIGVADGFELLDAELGDLIRSVR